ncbi:MAG: AAC(3) family N-acetyltransferase [Bacillati bacterium ANGP1]|uniref:Aminoglycoside N(3)-acetyltransferase n=1 Tax=Candidatus Segetimicrobium genomatis TaxID=2569760 RepID=A0A537IRR4_9BACT|nr:MAG: AAC(3) family N-acetyltransferase [Terrabacteria group bacterium ANGP1]
MRSRMNAPSCSTRARRTATRWFHQARSAYVRRQHAFGPDAFLSALRKVGVSPGDVLMVHSSFDRFRGFTGKPIDVILALQEAVGGAGTLLMPTMPFSGLALEYIAQGEILDVRRTPSRMGLLTELFRRLPDVVRSVHPTHPVAAWGANAGAMVAGHHLAGTPCGTGTPFARLLDYRGKILLLGTGVAAITFFHAAEEILEPVMPFTPFTKETFSLRCRDKDGNIVVCQTRLWDPELARRRNPAKLVATMKQRGLWHEDRVGRLKFVLLHAQDVLDTLRLLAERGIYCYDG